MKSQSFFSLFFYVLCIGNLCLSCKQGEKGVQTFETINFFASYQDKLPLSTFVDTIELIPLETTDENLIGEITRLVYKDDKYYLRSTTGMRDGKLFVFDRTGKFIQQVGYIGAGPGGYNWLKDFTITPEGEIVIADFPRLSRYRISDGKFLNSMRVDNLGVYEILYAGGNNILALRGSPINHGNYMFSLIDRQGEQLPLINRGWEEAVKCDAMNNWRFVSQVDTCYYFNYCFCDTIFWISQNLEQYAPAYYIDYGKKKLQEIEILPPEEGAYNQKVVYAFWESLKHENDYLSTASIGVGDNYLYIGSTDKSHNGYLTLYSIKTKKSFSTHKLIDDMFLKGNIITITGGRMPKNMDSNDILWEIEPEILMDGFKQYWSNLSAPRREAFKRDYAEWYRICTTLKEDDNPVLMRIKVKSF